MIAQSVMIQAANRLLSASGSSASGPGKRGAGFELHMGKSLQSFGADTGSLLKPARSHSKYDFNRPVNENGNSKSGFEHSGNSCRVSGKPASDSKAYKAKATDKSKAYRAADERKAYKTAYNNKHEDDGIRLNDEDEAYNTASGISAMLSDVQEAARNVLRLSQEEFMQLLSDAGITQAELTDPERLKDLFLVYSGNTDPMSLLTDEGLNQGLNELLMSVEEVMDASGIELTPEQLQQRLSIILQEAGQDEGNTGYGHAPYEGWIANEGNAAYEALLSGEAVAEADSGSNEADIGMNINGQPANSGYPEYSEYVNDTVGNSDVFASLKALRDAISIGNAYRSGEEMEAIAAHNAGQELDVNAGPSISEEATASGQERQAENASGGLLKAFEADISSEEKEGSNHKELLNKDAGRQALEGSFELRQDGLFDRLGAARIFQTEYMPDTSDSVRLKEIVDQIVGQIKLTLKQDNASMELALHPEGLGRVKLTVQAKNGLMAAQFIVHNDTAREAIEGNIQILKDALSEQGLKVENIEVLVSTNTFGQESSPGKEGQPTEQKKSRGQRLIIGSNEMPAEEPDTQTGKADIAGILGSSIDMTA